MRRLGWLLLLLASAQADPLALMPMPAKVVPAAGHLRIDSSFRVEIAGPSNPRLRAAADRFTGLVSRQTGISPAPGASVTVLRVECDGAAAGPAALHEAESYQLDVSTTGAHLQARTVVGVLRGFATFSQLIGPGSDGFQVPAVHIEDQPRFPWRGLMLDVVRHWMPVAVVERNLDAMAAVKLNIFHWHLSDDQGFRVESRRFPRLHELGSDGNFYTQAELRQVVAYAHDRGIRVVPEFDMPGHTTAWLTGYPELGSAAGPYTIERKWGVFEPTLNPARESTYAFLDALIGEMASLFPDPYFHIGGDEVDDAQWKRSDAIQTFAREHQLATSHDLQAYFNDRVQRILKKHGKTMIGWDEVMAPGLAPDTIIQSWHGPASLAEAAGKGYRSILSFGYYLDQLQPAATHYRVDPLDGIDSQQAVRILGAEACMWSEYVSAETVDSRIWPRTAAIAERLWSPKAVADVGSMYERLQRISRWLEWVGVEHRSVAGPMLDRLAGGRPSEALRVLAAASEALGIEGRRNLGENASLVPLNRFVDAVPPESESIRKLEHAVGNPAAIPELRARFSEWEQTETRIKPLAEGNVLVSELLPLARNLATAGRIGREALDYLESGRPSPDGWVATQLQILDKLEIPVAQVRLAAVRPVRLLVLALQRDGGSHGTTQALENGAVRCRNEPFCNGAATVRNWTMANSRSSMTLKPLLRVRGASLQ